MLNVVGESKAAGKAASSIRPEDDRRLRLKIKENTTRMPQRCSRRRLALLYLLKRNIWKFWSLKFNNRLCIRFKMAEDRIVSLQIDQ